MHDQAPLDLGLPKAADAVLPAALPMTKPIVEPVAVAAGVLAARAADDRTDAEAETPMMRQYRAQKALHPDTVLFFRLGDFYEMFDTDAVRAAEILQITLTSRSKGADRIPMCGVPYHSARRYIARLIAEGLRVAICEQVEAPGSGPGIVRREVVRVISPGTVLDEEVLEPQRNNFLGAVQRDGDGYAAALLDGSTGEFVGISAPDAFGLASQLAGREPRELLIARGEEGDALLNELLSLLPGRPTITRQDPTVFQPRRAAAYLKAHLRVASLDGFGLDAASALSGAAGAALRYLKDTQKTDAAHVDRFVRSESARTLVLDESALGHLEVLRDSREGGRRGSLLGLVDRTCTSMGARKLARWLSAPLRSVPEIDARLDAVQSLVASGVLRAQLRETLRGIADLERLSARLVIGQGNARDLRALGVSLAALEPLADALQASPSALLTSQMPALRALPSLAQLLGRALVDLPPLALKEGGLIRPGFDRELDRLVALSTSGKDILLTLEQRERERTGIGSLKVRYNRAFGYFIEITRANLHLVPADYIRKQTMVGAERFVTPELKTYEEQVLTAEDERCALEFAHFERLRVEVTAQAPALRAAADAVATVDVLLSFAHCAAELSYCRPQVEESRVLQIVAGRHPVVERTLQGGPFVPNDVTLDAEATQLLLITGPNMAGKSTVMRQVALTVLMAQAGSFVPAESARIGLCDRIFTRVGAADSLSRGQSTFMVEMTETAHLLHHATPYSLVLLDEVGRGTSTYDGMSIAWAVAEHLHDQIGARTLFATHYHELTQLADSRPRVKNVCVSVKESGQGVVFLHKLVEGAASRSYGIEVARLAGLPKEVVERAASLLSQLGKTPTTLVVPARSKKTTAVDWSPGGLAVAPGSVIAAPGAGSARSVLEAKTQRVAEPDSKTVAEPHPILTALTEVDLNSLTPLQALNLLSQWQIQVTSNRRIFAGQDEE